MKFPSVNYLFTQAITTLIRFYLPLAFSFFGTIIGLLQVDKYSEANNRLICTCVLGISLSLGSSLFMERSAKPKLHWLAAALCLVASMAYWQWLAPSAPFDDYLPTIIFIVLLVVMHLFVAIAPYIGHDEPTGFWRFNETLYTRLLLSGVFSGVLYVGLAVAVTACKILFKLNINDHIYPKLFIVIAGVFNTWFFLSGIPATFDGLNTEKVFPKLLKIFTQYILIPLVVLYMAILYAYGIRIIALWSLPKGWVSMLILCYSVAGILAMLLVAPLRDDKDTPWVRFFSRFFFVATLPLIVLLYVAIITRVSSYGITESRYYLLLMGAWLGFISLYFIFSAKKNIKVIPASLAILGTLSLAGPWGAFATSERSQLHRLEAILTKNKIWKPGEKIAATPPKIPFEDAKQARSIVRYFIDREKVKTLQPFLTANFDTIIARAYRNSDRDNDDIIKSYNWTVKNNLEDSLMPLFCANDKYEDPDSGPGTRDVNFITDSDKGIDIGGYSKAFDISFVSHTTRKELVFQSATRAFLVSLSQKDSPANIVLSCSDGRTETIPLTPLVNQLCAYPPGTEGGYQTQQQMTIDGTGAIKPRILIQSIRINASRAKNGYNEVQDMDFTLLIP